MCGRSLSKYRHNGDAHFFYHFDALGSVVALSDQGGALAESYAYSPFGEVTYASAVGNPYLFTGREYDPESGLYSYRNRYYSPELGWPALRR